MDNQHITPQHELGTIAPEQLLGAQRRAARVWTAVHNMQLVQSNVYPEAVTQAEPAAIAEIEQLAPLRAVFESIKQMQEYAADRGKSLAQMAIAWLEPCFNSPHSGRPRQRRL